MLHKLIILRCRDLSDSSSYKICRSACELWSQQCRQYHQCKIFQSSCSSEERVRGTGTNRWRKYWEDDDRSLRTCREGLVAGGPEWSTNWKIGTDPNLFGQYARCENICRARARGCEREVRRGYYRTAIFTLWHDLWRWAILASLCAQNFLWEALFCSRLLPSLQVVNVPLVQETSWCGSLGVVSGISTNDLVVEAYTALTKYWSICNLGFFKLSCPSADHFITKRFM